MGHQPTWSEHGELSAFRRDGLGRRVAPFALVALGAYALAPTLRPDRPGLVVISGVLTALTVVAAVLLPWERWPRPLQVAVPASYIGALAILWASAPSAHEVFAILLGVPIVWSALYGQRHDTLVTFAFAAAALAIGSGWGDWGGSVGAEMVTYLAVGGLAAVSIRRLVVDLERRERTLRQTAELSHEVDTTEPRSTACRVLVELARADLAAFVVPGADAPIAWAGGERAAPLDLDALAAPEAVRAALERAEPVIERDRASRARVILVLPLIVSDRQLGAFVMGWTSAHPRISDLDLSATGLVVTIVAESMLRTERLEGLDKLSRTDALTGLANRREWESRLPVELARAQRTDAQLVVAMGDIDHFKRFNDAHGHQAGDRLLAELGRSWSARVRTTDVLARYGGEEFVVALPDCGLPGALQRVETLRGLMPDGQTCSFGLALWNGEEDGDALVARADRALYAAKAAGRDRAVVDLPDTVPAVDGPLLANAERS